MPYISTSTVLVLLNTKCNPYPVLVRLCLQTASQYEDCMLLHVACFLVAIALHLMLKPHWASSAFPRQQIGMHYYMVPVHPSFIQTIVTKATLK